MAELLEIREKLKMYYAQYELYILPVVKFILALVTLSAVNSQLGAMARLNHFAIVFVASLACSFLPTTFIALLAALFSLLHLYKMGLELAAVVFCVYLLVFLLFFRFVSKDSAILILTPLLCLWKIPYVMPIAVGLIGSPISAVSVACGVVVYYVLNTVIGIAPTVSTMPDSEIVGKLRLVIDSLVNNKTMFVVAAAFVITVIVVYLLRRLSVEYAWSIAMGVGAIVNLAVLLVGDLIFDTKMSLIGAILGSILAVLICKVIEFFRFCVDYSRTEKVQFEDDEYYYYVKAVPKMTVAASSKTVKKINEQRVSASGSRRAAERTGSRQSAPARRSAGSYNNRPSQRPSDRTPVVDDRDYEEYQEYQEYSDDYQDDYDN